MAIQLLISLHSMHKQQYYTLNTRNKLARDLIHSCIKCKHLFASVHFISLLFISCTLVLIWSDLNVIVDNIIIIMIITVAVCQWRFSRKSLITSITRVNSNQLPCIANYPLTKVRGLSGCLWLGIPSATTMKQRRDIIGGDDVLFIIFIHINNSSSTNCSRCALLLFPLLFCSPLVSHSIQTDDEATTVALVRQT